MRFIGLVGLGSGLVFGLGLIVASAYWLLSTDRPLMPIVPMHSPHQHCDNAACVLRGCYGVESFGALMAVFTPEKTGQTDGTNRRTDSTRCFTLYAMDMAGLTTLGRRKVLAHWPVVLRMPLISLCFERRCVNAFISHTPKLIYSHYTYSCWLNISVSATHHVSYFCITDRPGLIRLYLIIDLYWEPNRLIWSRITMMIVCVSCLDRSFDGIRLVWLRLLRPLWHRWQVALPFSMEPSRWGVLQQFIT